MGPRRLVPRAGHSETIDVNPSLEQVLTLDALRSLAGERSYARGKTYHADELVGGLVEHGGALVANVHGTLDYRVTLRAEGGELHYSCTCPYAEDEEEFCKHLVAVGLTWLERSERGRGAAAAAAPAGGTGTRSGSASGRSSRRRRRAPPEASLDDVRSELASRDKQVLVDLILEQALEDDRLRRRLLMETASAGRGRGAVDLATYRKAVDEATRTRGFVDYRRMHAFARGIDDVVDRVERLLEDGHAADVIGLAEHALARVERAIESVDDSDGDMGGILRRLQEIHHRACTRAVPERGPERGPEPEALARRLFEWELRTDWDTFAGAAATYADVLGERGLAVYRALAEAQWAEVPALRPGMDDRGKYGRRFRLTRIMLALAGMTGDVEAVVAVRERDLSSAYEFLRIAETCAEAGRHEQATEWAERGVQAFPERTDSRLREFLAGEYLRRGRHDDGIELIWKVYTDAPVPGTYRLLKEHAEPIGRWAELRERALAHLAGLAAPAAPAGPAGPAGPASPAGPAGPAGAPPAIAGRMHSSNLVSIHLSEDDVDAAWQQARTGGCSDDLLLALARRRAEDHPADALPIYLSAIEAALVHADVRAYQSAVARLESARRLYIRLGRTEEFRAYLADVRDANKRRKNFLKLLDRTGWGRA
jgi:uncharacterized Zn finger protein